MDLPDEPFQKALDDYAQHVRWEIGYPDDQATLMLIGFAAGWTAHQESTKG